MKKFFYVFERKNKIYIKLFMMITIFIIIVIGLTSSILYKNYEQFGLSTIHSYENDKLAQTSYSATYMKQSASRLVMQLYVDRDMEELMYDFSNDMLQVKTCHDKLISYKATESFIHSIYIYNGKRDAFLTTLSTEGMKKRKDFYDKGIIDIIDNYKDHNILYPIPRKIPMPVFQMDEKHYSNVYTFIYYVALNDTQPLKSAIIVNIKEEWLRDMIKTMEINTDGEIFIINNDGIVVTGNHEYSMKANVSDKAFIQKILNAQNETGYFIDKVEGKKSVIHYTTSNTLRWKLISITPYQSIENKINKMKYITLLICVIILVLGVGCSILMSQRLWKPMKNIINKMNKLEKHKRESHNVLKNKILKGILNNENVVIKDNFDNIFNDFKIKLSREIPVALILFKIDQYIEVKDKYNYKDREVLKFAIMNITSEMCTQHFDHECIDMDEDRMVLIINIPDNQKQLWIDEIKEIIMSVQIAMEEFFQLSISVTVSSITDKLKNIHDVYIEALNCSQYRFYYGHKSILLTDTIRELEDEEYEYPLQKEQHMIDALMLGKIEDAIIHYQEMINQALNYSYHSMYQVLLRISLALSSVFKRMEKNYNFTFNFNFNFLFIEIGQFETIEQVNSQIFDFFEQVGNKIEENKNRKHDQLINSVIKMIGDNYSDINLSISTIADVHNMTSNYLNRIFKKHTNISISQFINQTRIEQIKIALEKTTKPISEIAEECGFTNTSYCYTLFKKTYGITPNEYRVKIGRK